MESLKSWTSATADLDWGVQRAFLDALTLAADGEVTLVYRADSFNGQPCLVNGVQQMLSNNAISPGAAFPGVVGAFDAVNKDLHGIEVNESAHYVSPLAAEILVRFFGELKPKPDVSAVPDLNALDVIPYCEPSDTEMQQALDNMGTHSSVSEDGPTGIKENSDSDSDSVHVLRNQAT